MKRNEYIINSTVNFGQCDTLVRLRSEAYFTSFQDIASRHAMILGIDDFALLENDNALWVVSKTKVKIDRLPKWNDEINIRTWPMGAEGVRCNRCYQIIKDGEVYINAITEWVIIDADTHHLRKIDETKEGYNIVAEIVNILVDEAYLAKDGKPDIEKMQLITYEPVHHGYVELGKRVGNAFSDGKKLK